jgi:hypothetical protein
LLRLNGKQLLKHYNPLNAKNSDVILLFDKHKHLIGKKCATGRCHPRKFLIQKYYCLHRLFRTFSDMVPFLMSRVQHLWLFDSHVLACKFQSRRSNNTITYKTREGSSTSKIHCLKYTHHTHAF